MEDDEDVLREGVDVKYAFIERNREHLPIGRRILVRIERIIAAGKVVLPVPEIVGFASAVTRK